MRPSQLAGPASQPSPPPPSSSWRQSARRVAGARARSERHATSSPACLPRQRDAATVLLGAAPIPWPYPPSLSCCSLSLSHGRTPPSPPFAIAAVTGHPSLPRLAQELRLDLLFLPTAPRVSGSPASPPTSPFPSSATGGHHRRFAALRPSPSPLTIPAAPVISDRKSTRLNSSHPH